MPGNAYQIYRYGFENPLHLCQTATPICLKTQYLMERHFCSDNASGVCPEVMDALSVANQNHSASYGNDPLTQSTHQLIKNELGRECEVFFVYNGTAANTLACKATLKSFESIICPDTAHIATHEVGAPINATGSKMLTIPATAGKITADQIHKIHAKETYWGIHAIRPRLVSISQSTEWGTVYTLAELAEIKQACHELNLLLHVDLSFI